jgi:uncharacterized protein (TIGR00251 family)
MARLTVKVSSRAARDEIRGWQGETLRVAVRAPPIDGRANDAVLDLLAARIAVPRASVRVVAGATGPRKLVEIEGLSAAELAAALAPGRV